MTQPLTRSATPWLFGPVRDLAFGCGLAYAAVFAALALFGDAVRTALPLGLAILPVTFLSVPHYGATLLRAYGRAEDRARYRFFTIWTTAALALLFAWGLRDVAAGSWLATVYLTWSPWHYAGQNFGVGLMFLRRRGVEVTPAVRRLLWWSFALSYGLVFLALHAETGAAYAPADFEGTVLRFRPIGIPAAIGRPALVAAAAACAGVTAAAFLLLARRARWRDLVPSAALVLTQALWFSLPTLARAAGLFEGVDPLSAGNSHYVFLWIATSHAAQYLWITSYYAGSSGGMRRQAGFLGKCLLAGAAVWTVPAVVFAPAALGRLPYDAGLALLVSSIVNLHHFVLDGAIWKLRDGRIARILLGGSDAAAGEAPARPWLRRTAVAAGAACLAVMLFAGLETELGFNAAIERRDVAAAGASMRRLAWIGRDGSEMHLRIANAAADLGDDSAAQRHYEDSIRLLPTAWAWTGLGRIHAQHGLWRRAQSAFDEALLLEPDHAVALLYAGVVAFRTGRDADGRERLLHARATAQRPEVIAEIEEVMREHGVAPAPR